MKFATLCYIRDQDKTLMIHRTKKEGDILKDFWNGLGGKIEEGETIWECVVREIFEESGLTLTNPILKGILTFPNNRSTGETWQVFVFVATEFSGDLINSAEGELRWVSTNEINQLNLQQADKIFIPWLDQNSLFVVKFNYDGDNLIDHEVLFQQ